MRCSERLGIVTVEQQHDTLIRVGIGRHRRAIDEKTYGGAIRIVVMNGKQNRLLVSFGIAPGAMRKEALVAKRPQMRVERVEALLPWYVDHRAPAALDRFFE